MCTTDLAVADDVRGGGCGLQWVRDGVGWRDGPAVGGGRASGGWRDGRRRGREQGEAAAWGAGGGGGGVGSNGRRRHGGAAPTQIGRAHV